MLWVLPFLGISLGLASFVPACSTPLRLRQTGTWVPLEGSSLLPYVAQKEHQETMWVLQEKGSVNVHTPAVGLVILLLTANILLFSKICLFLFKAWILLRMLKKKKKHLVLHVLFMSEKNCIWGSVACKIQRLAFQKRVTSCFGRGRARVCLCTAGPSTVRGGRGPVCLHR